MQHPPAGGCAPPGHEHKTTPCNESPEGIQRIVATTARARSTPETMIAPSRMGTRMICLILPKYHRDAHHFLRLRIHPATSAFGGLRRGASAKSSDEAGLTFFFSSSTRIRQLHPLRSPRLRRDPIASSAELAQAAAGVVQREAGHSVADSLRTAGTEYFPDTAPLRQPSAMRIGCSMPLQFPCGKQNCNRRRSFCWHHRIVHRCRGCRRRSGRWNSRGGNGRPARSSSSARHRIPLRDRVRRPRRIWRRSGS